MSVSTTSVRKFVGPSECAQSLTHLPSYPRGQSQLSILYAVLSFLPLFFSTPPILNSSNRILSPWYTVAQISIDVISPITDWNMLEVYWSDLVSSLPVSDTSQDSEGCIRMVYLSPWQVWGQVKRIRILSRTRSCFNQTWKLIQDIISDIFILHKLLV